MRFFDDLQYHPCGHGSGYPLFCRAEDFGHDTPADPVVSVGEGCAALPFRPAPRLADGIRHPLSGDAADRDWHGAEPGHLLPVLGDLRPGGAQCLRNRCIGVLSACCPDRRKDAHTDAAEFGGRGAERAGAQQYRESRHSSSGSPLPVEK